MCGGELVPITAGQALPRCQRICSLISLGRLFIDRFPFYGAQAVSRRLPLAASEHQRSAPRPAFITVDSMSELQRGRYSSAWELVKVVAGG